MVFEININQLSIAFKVKGRKVVNRKSLGGDSNVTDEMLIELAKTSDIRQFFNVYRKSIGNNDVVLGSLSGRASLECPCGNVCEQLGGSFRVTTRGNGANFRGHSVYACKMAGRVDIRLRGPPVTIRSMICNATEEPVEEGRGRKRCRCRETCDVMLQDTQDFETDTRTTKRAKREESEELNMRWWGRGGWMGTLARWMMGVGDAESWGSAWR